MAEAQQTGGFQRRSLRLLLLLIIVHTAPVIWITPVVGGTAPIVALLAFGFASLFTFDSEGVALGLMVLIPALIYTGLAWLLAWLSGKALTRLPRVLRLVLTGVVVVAPLLSVYFPIYTGGGHSSSSSTNLPGLFSGYLSPAVSVTYWIAFHVMVAMLYAGQFLTEFSPRLDFSERWGRPALKLTAMTLAAAIVYGNYANVICRPLAELGSSGAALCVAKSGRVQARYWYERAAADGNTEATIWLIENTPDRGIRLKWLTRGAQAGDPVIQYQLARHLRRHGGPGSEEEAHQWLESSAAGNYGPAQQQVVERLTEEVLRSRSRDLLIKRNGLLEKAAENGSQLARLRLAEHYARGSMGYPADMKQARTYYQALLASGETTVQETAFAMNRDSYETRLQQLDALQAGLDAGNPEAILELARLYLKSPLPGPGVRELGMQLFEDIAANDMDARQELIVMLRTGSDGADKDPAAARKWLLMAAQAGEVAAMDRVASNYLGGSEGFPVDYPEARAWIEALVDHYQQLDAADAERRLAALENHLKYIDRLEQMAGGSLLGQTDLETLAQNADADSQFQYALQLLAGHGAERRAEAVSRLQTAAELGHAEAAWRLVEIYERGFPAEINPTAARRELERAAQLHHFYATRELAARYEYGNKGFQQNLPQAINMYISALAAGHDNRYGWDLDPDNYNHYRWLESRLRQARLKLAAL